MAIVLNEDQARGLEICVDRYKKGLKCTCIAGYAGVGKSELVRHIIAALGLNPEREVAYASYTGRAAMVLQQKGNKNATTLHKLLYHAQLMPNGRYILKPKDSLPGDLKVVVIDEISLPPLKIMQQLARHNVHVICLGDPGQLPSVGGQDNGILQNPHVMLTKIMRQAEDSEIIRVSMDIRCGRPLQLFNGNEVKIIDKKDVLEGMYTWADIILCGRNETRRWINNYCRQLEGRGKYPEENERVICLTNNWDCVAPDSTALVNGLTGTIQNLHWTYNPALKKKDITCNFIPDFESLDAALGQSNVFEEIRIDPKIFQTGETTLTLQQKAVLLKDKKRFMFIPNEFDYGHCATAWKAQGGEWNNVLVFEEDFPFKKDEHKRFLYTCATRSKSKLVIVRKDK